MLEQLSYWLYWMCSWAFGAAASSTEANIRTDILSFPTQFQPFPSENQWVDHCG